MPYVCPAEREPIKGSVPCVVTMNTIINREKTVNVSTEITSTKRVHKLT